MGEAIVRLCLMKQGYQIVSQNALGYGFEIDIVSRNRNGYLFVEVKSVSHETPIDRPMNRLDSLLRVVKSTVEGGWRAILVRDSGTIRALSWIIVEMNINDSSEPHTVEGELLRQASERVDSR